MHKKTAVRDREFNILKLLATRRTTLTLHQISKLLNQSTDRTLHYDLKHLVDRGFITTCKLEIHGRKRTAYTATFNEKPYQYDGAIYYIDKNNMLHITGCPYENECEECNNENPCKFSKEIEEINKIGC